MHEQVERYKATAKIDFAHVRTQHVCPLIRLSARVFASVRDVAKRQECTTNPFTLPHKETI